MLMRFYGLSLVDVYGMDHHDAYMLLKAMEALQARENISELRVQDWPNLKKEARSKLFRDLNKLANPSMIKEERRPLTTEDLAALIRGY